MVAEDVIFKSNKIRGLVVNWAPVNSAGLHVDPLSIESQFVVDATGHDHTVTKVFMDKLKGKIPYHVYGGAYTEPMMNPYFMTFLSMTKKHNNHFGIHTNGTFLNQLEEHKNLFIEKKSVKCQILKNSLTKRLKPIKMKLCDQKTRQKLVLLIK